MLNDAKGVGTVGGGEESIEDGSIGVHNIHEPAVLERVNAFVKSIADREYIKPDKGALSQLSGSLGKIGLVFKDSITIEGKSGNFETGLTQHGGRFGKDTDGSDINDDGIQHRLGKELKIKGRYETLENGAVKVFAEKFNPMFSKITKDNWLFYAIKNYDYPNLDSEKEFYEDVKRFKYIKRLFRKYKSTR